MQKGSFLLKIAVINGIAAVSQPTILIFIHLIFKCVMIIILIHSRLITVLFSVCVGLPL